MSSPSIRKLGRYELLFLLGQGGMGEVHLARLTGAAGFEKLCIVKTVLPNLAGDAQFIDRFHHEARVLVQLTHSNIAQVHDMGEVDGTLYMAIEYVPGVDLSRIETRVERQQATMPLPVALLMGRELCEALGYAHRKAGADGEPLGIVHRDVSPQNVMVSYEGQVKVIDFGLAKSTARSKHTQANTVMGKLGYMAPEQAMAKPVDHRSDIFSAGIVVWEALAGRPLYESGTMSEMVARMAFAELPTLSEVRPEFPGKLNDIVMKALQRDPAQRYQRAEEFARALNEFAVREGHTTGSEEVGNFVRSICPEEFAAERQLRSRLSMMRKRPSQVRESDEVPTEQMQAIDGTFLRSGAQAPDPKTASGAPMTAAQRAMSLYQSSPDVPPKGGTMVRPQASEEDDVEPARGGTLVRPASGGAVVRQPVDSVYVAPRSRTPFVIAGLLAVIALSAGALWYTSRAAPAREAPDAGVPLAAVDTPATPVEPEKPVESPPDASTPVALVVLERVKADKVWRLQRKGDDDLLLLGRGDKLAEGDRLNLVGEEEDGERPVYAHAAVIEITGSIAHVLLDEDTQLPDPVYAARDNSGKPVAVKTTVKRKDPVVKTTEPSVEPVKQPTTEPVKQPTTTTASPTDQPTRQLYGWVHISAVDRKKQRMVVLTSQNPFRLTQCELRLPQNLVAKIPTELGPSGKASVNFNSFRADARPALKEFAANWSALYCNEGRGFVRTTYAP